MSQKQSGSTHTNISEDLFEVLINGNKFFIVGGLFAFFVHYFCIYLRWHYVLIKVGNYNLSFRFILRSLLGGNALGLLTPGRLGELARGVFFQKEQFWQVSGLSVIDKGYAHIVSIFLGVLGLWLLGIEELGLTSGNKYLLYVLITLLVSVGAVLVARPRLFSYIIEKSVYVLPKKWRKYGISLSENLKRLTKRESLMLALISLIINLTSFLEFYILLRAFTDTGIINAFIAFESAYLTVNFLPFSFSDLGIREGVRIFFFSLVGVSAAAVFNASLIMFFINSLLPSAVGLVVIPKIRMLSTGEQ